MRLTSYFISITFCLQLDTSISPDSSPEFCRNYTHVYKFWVQAFTIVDTIVLCRWCPHCCEWCRSLLMSVLSLAMLFRCFFSNCAIADWSRRRRNCSNPGAAGELRKWCRCALWQYRCCDMNARYQCVVLCVSRSGGEHKKHDVHHALAGVIHIGGDRGDALLVEKTRLSLRSTQNNNNMPHKTRST